MSETRASREDSPVPPHYETLEIVTAGSWARLRLARPERLNAMGATMLAELVDAAHWFDRQLDIRVVVIDGAGRAFSAGADLRDSPSSSGVGAHDAWQVRREAGQRGLRMACAIEQMRAVTIAQVHGYAIGGGLVLVSACDLRVAARGTVFSIPEVELGIPLAWGGIPRLVREIGPAMTKELVMTCRRFEADEAKAVGLLNRVVEPDRLEQEVQQMVERLLAMPAGPVIMTKDHVNAVSEAMAAARTASADGDVLLGALADPAGEEARQQYLRRTFGTGDSGSGGSPDG